MQSPSHSKRFAAFWLLLPWLTLIAIITAIVTGLATRILAHLPYGLDELAIVNCGCGMLIVTFGSSARWAYLRVVDEEEDKVTLIKSVIGLATFVTIVQIALGVWIAGVGILLLRAFR